MRPSYFWPPAQRPFNSGYYPYAWYGNNIYKPGIGAWWQMDNGLHYENYPPSPLYTGHLGSNHLGGNGYGYGNVYESSNFGGYGGYSGNGALRQFLGYWYPDYLGQRNRGNSDYGNNGY